MLLCRDHHKVIDTLIAEHRHRGAPRDEARARGARPPPDRPAGHRSDCRRSGDRRYPRRSRWGFTGWPCFRRRSPKAATRTTRLGSTRKISRSTCGRCPEETSSYWDAGNEAIKAKIATLAGTDRAISHISVFALTRIPFLVALGFHLDDKIPATIYPRRLKWGR